MGTPITAGPTVVLDRTLGKWRSRSHAGVISLLFMLSLYCRSSVTGQVWTEVPVPPPSGLDPGSLFGASVAVDGDLLLVGAPGADGAGGNSGAVFVFARNAGGLGQWEEVQQLQAEELSNGARFGTWMEWRLGTLLVGAPFDAVDGLISGSIHQYRRDLSGQFVEEQRIVPNIPGNNMRFGEHFDSANTGPVPLLLVASAPGADCDAQSTSNCLGSVLLYEAGTGIGFGEIDNYCPPNDLFISSAFARRVALVNAGSQSSVVTAINGKLMSTAAASVSDPDDLEGGHWPTEDTLVAADVWGRPVISAGSEVMARFGTLYATASTDAHRAVLTYTYGINFGELEQNGVLLPDTTLIHLADRFGYAIAPNAELNSVDNEPVAVGAPGAVIGMPVGSCTVFQRDFAAEGTWRSFARLVPSDAEMGALFGASVSMSWPYVAVGAPGHGPDDLGKVYVFEEPSTSVVDGPAYESRIRLYPVPVKEVLHVDLSQAVITPCTYSVMDPCGRVLRSGTAISSLLTLDLVGLPPASYILRVDAHGASYRNRFVISH